MDFFKLGLRNIVGIIMPGTIAVLIFLYTIYAVAFTLNISLAELKILKELQFSMLLLFLIISYFLGSILRLNAADNLDAKAKKLLLKQFKEMHPEIDEKALEKARKEFSPGLITSCFPKFFDSWVWRVEIFPYPVWQFRKFDLYHPQEMLKFYESYRNCMGIGPGRRGKEFFNYCKMVIYHAGRELGNAVVDEVHFAEAIVRFYAGTYYSLFFSFWILLFLILLQVVYSFSNVSLDDLVRTKHIVLITLIMIFGLLYLQKLIVKRFRTLRLKEVDTVYDAFYLVHRHAQFCLECSKTANDLASTEEYQERKNLLMDAHSRSAATQKNLQSVHIENLVSLMKERSRVNDYLSSFYFAGVEVDHPYFLKNDRLALGIAVLPEDARKAGMRKRHPYQQEVIFVLQGSINLEVEENGQMASHTLNSGEVFIIGKDQCHCISPVNSGDSVYLFAKTNPSEEPRGLDCNK
jgi:hypothetical protein